MPNYQIDLFTDVGFTADYANVLHFESEALRDDYFDAQPHMTFTGTSVNKSFQNGGTVKLAYATGTQLPFDMCKTSYMRITSTLPSSIEQTIVTYCFVTGYDVVGASDNITTLEFAVLYDVWMNHQFGISFAPCAVERMHVTRWTNSSADNTVTTPCLDLIESYYQTKSETVLNPVETPSVSSGDTDAPTAILVVVYTTGYNESGKTPFKIVCAPAYDDTTKRVPCLDSSYFGLSDIIDGTLASGLEIAPSSIVSVYIQRYPNYLITKELGRAYYTIKFYDSTFTPKKVGQYYCQEVGLFNKLVTKGSPVNNQFKINATKPSNGVKADWIYEPAMFRAPVVYHYVIYANTAVQIPQNIIDSGAFVHFMSPITIDGSPVVMWFGKTDDDFHSALAKGWAFEMPTLEGNIINDQWLEYLYTSRSSDRAMMWTNIATLGLADMGSTAVSGSIGYRSNITQAKARQLEYNTQEKFAYKYGSQMSPQARYMNMLQRAELDAKGNLATGMAVQSMRASAMGGVASIVAGGVATYASQEFKESAIKNQPAKVVSAGDYAGMYQSDTYNATHVITEVEERAKQRYYNMFKLYGYAINSVLTPEWKNRKYFNYLKTNGAIINASCPQAMLMQLQEIFDSGTTIWHMDNNTRETLYNYEYENIERSLI